MASNTANDIANRLTAIEQELDEKFPNRPKNHKKTLPFHDLFLSLFNPLNDNKKKPTGPAIARAKQGPHGPTKQSPHELRRSIIERFISKWRNNVGNDIYPAFRLIVPDKDRDRAMYGLKEKAIAKLLLRAMRISKDSPDGQSLIDFKRPGYGFSSAAAGDFALRCFEVINKRPLKEEPGDLTVEEVNRLLDKLSIAQTENTQLPIFQEFYANMNAEELTWLIRIILRQMKIGATERTFFEIWHPDAESLYNVSSSLRRVCWELYDPAVRLENNDKGINLMQCFQPQLAQFQMHSFQKMVDRMRPTEEDRAFWIEEKLDGERMQLHMINDASSRGGKRFNFWSRKAKDYTYLYGNSLYDDNSALTCHLKEAFHEGVRNIILDGEMITWDPNEDKIVGFGTLKTAALAEQRNPFSNTGQRPLYRLFDVLYLNDLPLTDYTLRDRRAALEQSVRSVHRRMEVHPYHEASSANEIEPMLRKVVAEASEGLVLKNPRSVYRLNERNDDWMKVKPEYMTEYGESLDCIVVGGYYGSGRRGGNLSSFLCGLKVYADQERCYSFFKVGGGFAAEDYAQIRHDTEGKWKEWDPKRPPTEYVELAGGNLQFERPDMWIRPSQSVVLSVKAASINVTDQFRTNFTLRFPRFQSLRRDRDWKSALTIQEFIELKSRVEEKEEKKQFEVDQRRRKRTRIITKKPITILGNEDSSLPLNDVPTSNLFEGLNFCGSRGFFWMSELTSLDIMTGLPGPKTTYEEKSKTELEQMVRANGAKIYQVHDAVPNTICVAGRRPVKVAALQKAGKVDIVHPQWIIDCLKQHVIDSGRPKYLLPWEPR